MFRISNLCTGRWHDRFHIGMIDGGNRFFSGIAAICAVKGVHAFLCTGGRRLFHGDAVIVTGGRSRAGIGIVTCRAGMYGCPVCLTGCPLGDPFRIAMACRRNGLLWFKYSFTYGAVLSFGQSGFRAGSGSCCIDDLRVSQCGGFVALIGGAATGAGVEGITLGSAGRRDRLLNGISMRMVRNQVCGNGAIVAADGDFIPVLGGGSQVVDCF